MAIRGRPRKPQHSLAEAIKVISTDIRKRAPNFSRSFINQLFGDFIWYARTDPLEVRRQLSIQHPLSDGDEVQAYKWLPPDLIIQWAKASGDWQQEPVIVWYVNSWQHLAVAFKGQKDGASARRHLTAIDPSLIPTRAKGAGKPGHDTTLTAFYEQLVAEIADLHKLFYGHPKKAYHTPAGRHRRLGEVYDIIVSAEGFWRRYFTQHFFANASDEGSEDQPSPDDFSAHMSPGIVLLDWLIPAHETTPRQIASTFLSETTGLAEQTVHDSVSRERQNRSRGKD
jgi:hypothetical protein